MTGLGRISTVVALALSTIVVGAVQATAADGPVVVADWQMNELQSDDTMADSSGNGITASLDGLSVIRNGAYYDFNEADKPNKAIAPEHIVRVPHTDALNPGTGTYAVEFRYRTDRPYGNIVQKGQAGARGGYWKFQLPQGEVSCLFRGPSGSNSVRYQDYKDYGNGVTGRLDDDEWHTVRCERFFDKRGEGLRMYVDGQYVGINRGNTGVLANREPVYIGGKGFCNQVTITCDYFGGEIDWVRIERP